MWRAGPSQAKLRCGYFVRAKTGATSAMAFHVVFPLSRNVVLSRNIRPSSTTTTIYHIFALDICRAIAPLRDGQIEVGLAVSAGGCGCFARAGDVNSGDRLRWVGGDQEHGRVDHVSGR